MNAKLIRWSDVARARRGHEQRIQLAGAFGQHPGRAPAVILSRIGKCHGGKVKGGNGK